MIICPILSQPRRAEDGAVTWEHHECLRDGCTFWAAEASDCALRASGLAILRREGERPEAGAGAAAEHLTLLSATIARLGDMEGKMEAAAERTSAASRDMGLRVLEGVAALEQPVNAVRGELDALRGRIESLGGVLDGALAVVEDHRRREEERARRDRLEEARECNSRGLALFHRGDVEAASSAFRRAAELDPALAEAHNNLGLALGRLGRAEEAAAALEKALEIRPDLGGALNNLGFLAHEGMAFEKAADLFRRAALADPDSSIAYANLGNALFKMHRHAEAVDAWKRALEKDPLNEAAASALKMFEGAEGR